MAISPLGITFGAENITSMSGGRKVVTTGGTSEQVVTVETPCSAVVIQSLRTNSGNVAIGGPDVDVTAGSENGIELTAGQISVINLHDLSILYIDADNSNEGINYLLLKG